MFKPLQIVEFHGVIGIVSAVQGHGVTIMWEDGSHGVSFRHASAIQWRKSIRVVG
jgi:hypothetical protein